MLWSLSKVLVFVAIVVGLAFGVNFIAQSQDNAQLTFLGNEYNLSALTLVLGFIVLVVLVWLGLKVLGLLVALLRFINGDETAFSRYFDRNRERRGFDALSDGLIAMASGDGASAVSKAKKADRLLERPELTNLVLAQAAEQAGDRQTAEKTYKKLLQNKKSRFVGIQGLLKQKLADGDTETALKLAEKAFALKPSHAEVGDALLKLQASEEDWKGARATLGSKLKSGNVPRDLHRRRDGVFALSQARDLRADGKVDEAQILALEANRLTPGLVPAAVMAAKGYLEQDKPKLAAKVLKAAWDQEPHPDIAAAFAALAPDEAPDVRIKRFKTLTRGNAKHPETQMLNAELLISAEQFPEARRAIGDLAETDPTMRSLTIMAAIEKGEGSSDDVVREYLTKALTAQRDPEWTCDNCGEVHKDWEPTCFSCGGLDTISWKRPARSEHVPSGMLPLLSGPSDVPELAEEVATGSSDDNVILLDSAKNGTDG